MFNGVQRLMAGDRDQFTVTKTPEGIIALVKSEPEPNRCAGEAGNQCAAPLIGKIDHQMIMLSA